MSKTLKQTLSRAARKAVQEASTLLDFELIDMSKPFRLGEGPALWADACYCRRSAANPSDAPALTDG
jgi:hypothetical protein